jgi:DNA modification methylase
MLGRQFIGFEISDEYCQLARKRIMAANVPLFQLSEPEAQIAPAQMMIDIRE